MRTDDEETPDVHFQNLLMQRDLDGTIIQYELPWTVSGHTSNAIRCIYIMTRNNIRIAEWEAYTKTMEQQYRVLATTICEAVNGLPIQKHTEIRRRAREHMEAHG